MRDALVRWAIGTAALLVIDMIAEALVFEWLAWNGTTKNDWFFVLWWLSVLAWTTHCVLRIWQAVNPSSD
jgi:hypothetical protein